MTDLSRLADMAEILGVLIVIGGVLFAILQMRQIRQQRRELAAIELFRFFGNPQFACSYQAVLQLPDGLSKAELSKRELDDDAMLISTTMENIGVMMYHRIIPSLVVNHLIGASVVILWSKLEAWVNEMRADLGDDAAFEWFQWLAERMGELHEPGLDPAYIRYRRWRPSRMSQEL